MFHLHRLEHQQSLAFLNGVTLRHIDRNHLARHWGEDGAVG